LHRAQPQTSNFIQIGFDFTESGIDYAFDLDWSVMKWDWLQPSELLKNQLGDVLKQNYTSLCNLFAHYCGVGQGNQPDCFFVHAHYFNCITYNILTTQWASAMD